MSSAILAKDLYFAYNGRDAVAGVSLSVDRGRFVSLIGPNGSGKTTLLRLLSGVLSPRKGSVEILGRDVKRMNRREVARAVAAVPQDTSSVFPFTVEEIVLMGRFPHLTPYGFEGGRDVEIAREAMRLTSTLEFAGRGIHELSGGERQRVIIARALAQEADILLLDEPTAFLDIKHQVEITRLVKSLQGQKGLTVVAASHDISLAAAFSDTLVLLKAGRVFAQGPPREVLKDETLSRAYETDVTVGTLRGAPVVAPLLEGTFGELGDRQ